MPGGVGQNSIDAYWRYRAHGYTHEQAVGFVGGLMGESGRNLNPASYNANDPGGSVHIGQWNRDRRFGPTGIEGFKSPWGARNEVERGVDFSVWEMKNREAAAGKMLSSASDIPAAVNANLAYERPKVPNPEHRVANAMALNAALQGSTGPSSGQTTPVQPPSVVTPDGTAPAPTAAGPVVTPQQAFTTAFDKAVEEGKPKVVQPQPQAPQPQPQAPQPAGMEQGAAADLMASLMASRRARYAPTPLGAPPQGILDAWA